MCVGGGAITVQSADNILDWKCFLFIYFYICEGKISSGISHIICKSWMCSDKTVDGHLAQLHVDHRGNVCSSMRHN